MTAAVSTSVLPSVNLAAAASAPPMPMHGAGFAQMLDARRAEAPYEAAQAEPKKADEPKREDTSATENPQATRTADEARNRQLRAQRLSGTRPHGTDSAPVHEARPVEGPAQPVPQDAPVEAADDTEPAVDPALAEWLASLNLPPAQPAQPAAEVATSVDRHLALPSEQLTSSNQAEPELTARPDVSERGASRRATPALGGHDATRRHGPEDLNASQKDIRAGRQAAEMPAAFQAAMEQAAASPARARELAGDAPKVDLAAATQAMSAAASVAGRPAAEMAVTAVVHMATPADAPEFTQALGAELSVLAKDGVQQAELHLNPADMGPISVQIALDGDLAKVDFGADSAATRHIIETGLPELAAALRDAGFTLSGGGVHSQAQQQGQREREGARARIASDGGAGPVDDVAATPRAPVRTVRAGGVDLYA